MKFEEGRVGMEVVVKNVGCSVPVGTRGVIKELTKSKLFNVKFPHNSYYVSMHHDHFSIINKNEFPIPFIIKGEMHHLEAFAEDLKKIGYTILEKTYSKGNLRLNGNCFKSHRIEIWKQVCYSTNVQYKTYEHTPAIEHQEFSLPQQWNDALEFADEFLKHPFWNQKKEEILDIKHSDGQSFQVIVNDKIIYQENDNITEFNPEYLENFYKLLTNSKLSGYSLEIPYLGISCKKNIPITEIKRIIDTYKKLNS